MSSQVELVVAEGPAAQAAGAEPSENSPAARLAETLSHLAEALRALDASGHKNERAKQHIEAAQLSLGADAAADAAPLKLYVVRSAFGLALDATAEANGSGDGSSTSGDNDHPHIVPVGRVTLAERMARAYVRLTTVRGSENAKNSFFASSLCGTGVAALALLCVVDALFFAVHGAVACVEAAAHLLLRGVFDRTTLAVEAREQLGAGPQGAIRAEQLWVPEHGLFVSATQFLVVGAVVTVEVLNILLQVDSADVWLACVLVGAQVCVSATLSVAAQRVAWVEDVAECTRRQGALVEAVGGVEAAPARQQSTLRRALKAKGESCGESLGATVLFGLLLPLTAPSVLVAVRVDVGSWASNGSARGVRGLFAALAAWASLLLFDALRYLEVRRGILFESLLVDELVLGGAWLLAAMVYVFVYARRGLF